MWACARYDFGLSERDTWWITPRQFAALARRYHIAQRRHDLRFGVVASTVANVNRDSKKHPQPYTADDFFPEVGKAVRSGLPKLSTAAFRAELVAAGVEVRSRSQWGDDGAGD